MCSSHLRQRRSISALASGASSLVAAGIAIGVAGAGFSPVWLWGAGVAGLMLLLARRMPWHQSLAGAVIGMLFYLLIGIRLLPADPDRPLWLWLVVWAAPAVVSSVVTVVQALRRPVSRVITRSQLSTLLSAAVPVAAGALTWLAIVLRWGSDHITWAMNRDAVTSLTFARFLLEDGGVTAERPNPLLLPYGMIAAVVTPGRAGLEPVDLLQHDIVRMAELWIVVILTASLLAGLIAATSVPPRRPVLRLVAGLLAGAIPLSWFVAGSAFAFGFFNATLALTVLLASWLVWRGAGGSPARATSLLLLASTVLLATWTPFGVVTGSLALVLVVRHRRALLGSSRRSIVALAVAASQLLAWGILVTVPDFLRDGQYLGSGGGIFDTFPFVLTAIALLAGLLAWAGRRGAGAADQVGVVTVLVSSAPLLLYFLSFRWGTDDVWTYYPAKFGWLLAGFLLVISVALAARLIAGSALNGWRAAVAAVLSAAGIIALMFGSVALNRGPSDVYPAVAIWKSTSISEHDPYAPTVFALSSPEEANLVVRYNGVDGDYFANAWLLQANVDSLQDPVREYAYSFFAWDASDTCDVVDAVGRPVTVWTRDAGLEQELAAECSGVDYTVRLVTG